MSASNGHELAVFGSVGAPPPADGAAEADAPPVPDEANGADAFLEGAGAAAADEFLADAAGAPPVVDPVVAAAVATVACTSCSVMTCGGIDVMIVALNLLPSRQSDSCAGLPSFMIFTPRLSTSPCVKLFTPSSVRTMIVEPERTTTVPFFTSVTVTGVTVVRVVMVAVPFKPGFNCCTDNICPLTLKRKSSATVSSLVPSGSLTI